MNGETQWVTGQGKDVQSVYRSNLRLLDLILIKKLISEKRCRRVKSILKEALENENQPFLDQVPEVLDQVRPETLYKECFKYSQVILKLSKQFLKNTLTQKTAAEPEEKEGSREHLTELDGVFSDLLTLVTEDYLAKRLSNIDRLVLETKVLGVSKLQFIHNTAMHLEVKAMDTKFGEIAIKNQFSTQTSIKSALSEQTRLYLKSGRNHIIGDILVDRKEMTPEIRNEILLLQNRVAEEDWEDTLRQSGQSAIEEQEKSALFGALVLKEKLVDKAHVIEALKRQKLEKRAYEDALKKSGNPLKRGPEEKRAPRWIGDILVEDFGLSQTDRKNIVERQMKQRLEIINLKFGVGLKDTQKELIQVLDTYFQVQYSENRLQAFLRLSREIPDTMTTTNVMLWLYHKKITNGIISNAVQDLLKNRIQPGHKIVVARGTPAVPEKLIPKVLFKRGSGQACPPIVRKGVKLVSLIRHQGESGMNVNHCFITPPKSRLPVIVGDNVILEKIDLLAECDGVPDISAQGVVSVSPLIEIPGNLDSNDPAIDHDCDVHVHGTVFPCVRMKCRYLTATEFEGEVLALGDVNIKTAAKNARIVSNGNVNLPTVKGSEVTSRKNITLKRAESGKDQSMQEVAGSFITCEGVCIVTNLIVTASVLQVKERIVFRKTRVEGDCRLVVGESMEIVSQKEELKKNKAEIEASNKKILSLQEKMLSFGSELKQSDLTDLDNRIVSISRKVPKMKFDLDKLHELEREKRQLERESKATYNKYGSLIITMSRQIDGTKKSISDLEKKKALLEAQILSLYGQEKTRPEIDARTAVLAKGLVLDFPHASLTLDADFNRAVFREEFDEATRQYRVRTYAS